MLAEEPAALFSDPDLLEQLVAEIETEIQAFEVDLDSVTGRKAVASLAYGIAQRKTALDGAGKSLNEEHQAAIEKVNTVRRAVKMKLDELKTAARKPLDDWEARQDEIKAEIRTCYMTVEDLSSLPHGVSAAQIMQRLGKLQKMEVDAELIGPDEDQKISHEIQRAIEALQGAYDRELQAEKDRAELARIKAEQAETERAKEAERAKAEAEKREADRLEQVRLDAAAEAQRKARAEAEAKILEAERKQQEAERELAAKKAEEDRLKAEAAKRESDRAHRTKIMKAAKEAIMEAGSIGEPRAKSIVLAIASNSIPNIKINF